MEKDYNQVLNEKMNLLPVREVLQGFDKDAEWSLLASRLHPVQRQQRPFRRLWAAAALLLLLVGTGAWFFSTLRPATDRQVVGVMAGDWVSMVYTPPAPTHTDVIAATALDMPEHQQSSTSIIKEGPPAPQITLATEPAVVHHTGEYICNATPCPIEICIIQKPRCPGMQNKAVATCSILQPDQQGQIKYKAIARNAPGCRLEVEEIRIRRVTTGETIVLTNHSGNVTARELFDYMTGNEKSSIVAGAFDVDCNNECNRHSLTIGNGMGSLLLQ